MITQDIPQILSTQILTKNYTNWQNLIPNSVNSCETLHSAHNFVKLTYILKVISGSFVHLITSNHS